MVAFFLNTDDSNSAIMFCKESIKFGELQLDSSWLQIDLSKVRLLVAIDSVLL